MGTLAIVMGSGRTLWDDLRAIAGLLKAERNPAVWFAVNDMIVFAPTVHHAVSHHPEKLVHWIALRGGQNVIGHSSKAAPGVDRVWPDYALGRSGSSSLLATRIALATGHDRVIVAGVPLDAGGYLWSDPSAMSAPRDFSRYRRGWDDLRGHLRGRVTAVSGYLAELLGTPVRDGEVAA